MKKIFIALVMLLAGITVTSATEITSIWQIDSVIFNGGEIEEVDDGVGIAISVDGDKVYLLSLKEGSDDLIFIYEIKSMQKDDPITADNGDKYDILNLVLDASDGLFEGEIAASENHAVITIITDQEEFCFGGVPIEIFTVPNLLKLADKWNNRSGRTLEQWFK